LGKYVNISVPIEVKKCLQSEKGSKTWGNFLLEKCSECRRPRGKEAFEELRRLLTKEDLGAIKESSKDFSENFAFR